MICGDGEIFSPDGSFLWLSLGEDPITTLSEALDEYARVQARSATGHALRHDKQDGAALRTALAHHLQLPEFEVDEQVTDLVAHHTEQIIADGTPIPMVEYTIVGARQTVHSLGAAQRLYVNLTAQTRLPRSRTAAIPQADLENCLAAVTAALADFHQIDPARLPSRYAPRINAAYRDLAPHPTG